MRRNTIIIVLLFIITMLTACSNSNESGQSKNTNQALNRPQIDEIIKAWGISEEEYFLLMKDRFTSSLARANWGTYLDKYGDSPKTGQGYVAKSPLWIDDDKIKPLLDEVKVEVTSDGRQLGISY